jgi:endonuclease YncB( thermonuclease family)
MFRLIFAIFALGTLQPATSEELLLRGKLHRLLDGDTIEMETFDRGIVKIRLAGIDAPEKLQRFGDESTISLGKVIQNKKLYAACNNQDRYRRLLCKVSTGDGVDINLSQVENGLAWHYKQYSSNQSAPDRLVYSRAEKSARANKIGLWKDQHAIAPWDFRSGKSNPSQFGDAAALETPTKMSKSKICHAPNSKFYAIVKNFKAYENITDCILAGGRLPNEKW